MEELLAKLLENPDVLLEAAKMYVEKYKPVVYGVAQEFVNVYKDYSENKEYFAVVAKAKKNLYDAYMEAGFNEDQSLALMINDNLKLMDNVKRIGNKRGSVKKEKK
jgi:hypothetical protein